MKTSAKTLRTLVCDNSLTLGRLTKETLGNDDYRHLTALYTSLLDSLTEWASKDYAHKSTKEDADACFAEVKKVLEIFDDGETRVAIDQSSMRTLRDLATKPKRLYSAAYTDAEKERKAQEKQALSRLDDLLTLGAPKATTDIVTAIKGIKEVVEMPKDVDDYLEVVKAAKFNHMVGSVDMIQMFENAVATLVVKTKAVEDIKAAGNWTWKRPVAVALPEFADLVENYVADCLIDGYNIKPSAMIREEKAAARKANA